MRLYSRLLARGLRPKSLTSCVSPTFCENADGAGKVARTVRRDTQRGTPVNEKDQVFFREDAVHLVGLLRVLPVVRGLGELGVDLDG